MAQYLTELDDVFAALGDSTRRAVVGRLGSAPASVSDLAGAFPMALSSFLKHIRILERSGLVSTHKSGRVRVCTLNRERLGVLDGWLEEQRAIWAGRTDRLEHFVTQRKDDSES